MLEIEKMKDFLKKVYPCLSENYYSYCAGEIRFVNRGNSKYKHHINIWRIDNCLNKSQNRLQEKDGERYCTYYSSFLINTDIGKTATNRTTCKTYILPIDFDLSEEDFLKEKAKLDSLKIQTLDIFTGHGYQSIILLEEAVADKDIYKKFTSLLLKKGFVIDSSIKDSARMLRMPYTINNKCEVPVETFVLNDTDCRYSLDYVFQKISELSDFYIGNDNDFRFKANNLKESEIDILFSEIYDKSLGLQFPYHIKKMLVYSEEKYRNNTFFFLIHFFLYGINMHISIAEKVAIQFHMYFFHSSEVTAQKEFHRLVKYKIDLKAFYNEHLFSLYGAFALLDDVISDTVLKIPKVKSFYQLPENAVLSYFKIVVKAEFKHGSTFTKGELSELLGLSNTGFYTAIHALINHNLLVREKSSRSKHAVDYKVNCYFYNKGFYIRKSCVSHMAANLKATEFMVYLMLKEINGLDEFCYPSQSYLASELQKERSTITKVIKNLEKKGFLVKRQYHMPLNLKKYNKYFLCQ